MRSTAFLATLALSTAYAFAFQIGAKGLPDGPPSKIQDCANGGDYAGPWGDENGTYINSDSVRYNLGKKCWNDYRLVTTKVSGGPWSKLGGNFYCTHTERCYSGETHSNQACLAYTKEISGELAQEAAKLAATLSIGVSFSWTNNTCTTDSRNNQCSWDDGECHTIWAQPMMVTQTGIKIERCNTGDKDFTNCMSNWESHYPSGVVNYGCGSKCGDTNNCGNTNGTACVIAKRTVPMDLKA